MKSSSKEDFRFRSVHAYTRDEFGKDMTWSLFSAYADYWMKEGVIQCRKSYVIGNGLCSTGMDVVLNFEI